MSFPAIQFARHIAQFHIQFYGRTGRTPIYFTVVLSHPPITVYPLTLARLPLSDLPRFLYLLKSTRKRGHPIIPADMDGPTRPFPFRVEQIRVARLITRETRFNEERKRSGGLDSRFTRFRYANQTSLYREPRINYSLDTCTTNIV